jgi:hypothetical protein
MSHWAQLDENNIVLTVMVGDNNDPNGDEGEAFYKSLGGTWVKTSYNGTIRKNYAIIGGSYNPELDAFIAPQPYPSFTLNRETACWECPVQLPQDTTKQYKWEEETLTWVEVNIEG